MSSGKGGYPVTREHARVFTSSVKIEDKKGDTFLGGGTLVAPNIVVTSAFTLLKHFSKERVIGENGIAHYSDPSELRVAAGKCCLSILIK